MVPVILQNINARRALELVDELKSSGLTVNQDFEWAYHHEHMTYDLGGSEITPRYCEFKFKDAKLATFYTLKWMK